MKKKTNIQVAFDFTTAEDCLSIAEKIHTYVDVLEVGTPMIYEYGVGFVSELRKKFKYKTILADLKIADAGYEEAVSAFKSGADIVTVLSISNDSTIEAAIKAAREYKGKIFVDLLCEKDIIGRTKRLIELGVDIIGVHNAFDQQKSGSSPYEEFETLSNIYDFPIAVAGGIKLDNIAEILELEPYQVIIGQGLLNKPDLISEAEKIFKVVNGI